MWLHWYIIINFKSKLLIFSYIFLFYLYETPFVKIEITSYTFYSFYTYFTFFFLLLITVTNIIPTVAVMKTSLQWVFKNFWIQFMDSILSRGYMFTTNQQNVNKTGSVRLWKRLRVIIH